jgi:histidinol-phosphatase
MDDDADELRALLDEAVSLARQAGRLTDRWFQAPDLAVDTKADATPVTVADRAVERFLRTELATRHPDDAIVGEEEEDRPGHSGRRWVIDPIDGTRSFTCGVPLFATLLALLEGDEPLVGVIHLPSLDETVAAARGRGCWVNGRPARVAGGPDGLAGAMIMTSGIDGWEPAHLARLAAAGAHVRTWGDAYGYALVATGRVAAMVDPVAALWDLAPVPVILEEAGGRFTTVDGRSGPDGGSGVGSRGGRLHDELLSLLRA